MLNRSLLLSLLLAACSSPPQWSGDVNLYGVYLVIAPDGSNWTQIQPTWVHDPALPQRLKQVMAEVAGYYHRDPETLAGLRIVLDAGQLDCDGVTSIGCMNYGDNTLSLNTRYNSTFPCIEFTKIAHELLHHFLGESSNSHIGKDWDDLPALEAALMNESQILAGYCSPRTFISGGA